MAVEKRSYVPNICKTKNKDENQLLTRLKNEQMTICLLRQIKKYYLLYLANDNSFEIMKIFCNFSPKFCVVVVKLETLAHFIVQQ